MSPDSGRRAPARALPDLIAVAIPVALGALLTAIDLGSRSIWLDEGSTFAIVSQHGAALWRAIAHDGGNMFLYYVVMHVLVGWFGHGLVVLRLPSVVASACTGGLVAAMALRLFPGNRRLAAAAGALAVASLPLVYWGQNARGYAWLVTLATASFLGLVMILQTPSGAPPARGAVAVYALSTLGAMYVGYDVALIVPAQLALLLVCRERARVVVGSLAFVALLSVPLLVLAVERGSGQLFWVPALDWQVAGQSTLALLSAALLPNFHAAATTAVAAAVLGLALLAGLVLAVRTARGGMAPDGADVQSLRVLLSWILVTAVLTVIAYAVGEPIELERTTILVVPAVALLMAWLLLRPAVAPALGLVGVTVLLVLRLAQVLPSYGVSPEPWSRATAYVLGATQPTRPACVAFYAQDGREAFDYYLLAAAPPNANGNGTGNAGDPAPSLEPVLPSLPWATVRPFVERYDTLGPARQARIVARCPRLWLISSHAGQTGGTARSLRNLRRYQLLEHDLRARYPHTSVRSFGWASAVVVQLLWRGSRA